MQKIVNGVLLTMTPEEEAAFIARQEQAAIELQAIKEAEAAALANRISAKAKLEALGLTADEVRDTFGL